MEPKRRGARGPNRRQHRPRSRYTKQTHNSRWQNPADTPEFRPQQKPSEFQNSQPRTWDTTNSSEQCTELSEKLIGRELDCLICMHLIGWRGKVWTCSVCKVVVHLTCIKQWREKSGVNWNCPACNEGYKTEPRYFCYCGK